MGLPKMNLRFVLFAGTYFLCALLLIVVLLILYPFTMIFDPYKRRAMYHCFYFFNWFVSRLFFSWEVTGIPVEELPCPAVWCVSHQTNFDHLFCHLFSTKHFVRNICKSEVRSYPIFGWMIRLLGIIFVSKDKAENAKSIDYAVDLLKHGVPIQIFPEGTRWWLNNRINAKEGKPTMKPGELGVLHTGAAKMAIEANVPIIPIAAEMRHLFTDYPAMLAFPGAYKAKAMKPIYPEGRTPEEIMELVRQEMEEGMREIAMIPEGYNGYEGTPVDFNLEEDKKKEKKDE